ncbi:MAG: N-acetyltransferase family protein [Solirubrobacteraceae bacterium]|nr:N-acetyltransferase family protein [Patulibacter sp.]
MRDVPANAADEPVIRVARLPDLTPIVGIYNASIPSRRSTADLEPVTVESRTAWFVMHAPDHRPIWVADLDGEVQAWLSFSDYYGRPAYDSTVEVGVYVAPEAQGRGLGGRLLEHAIAAAPALGVRTLLWITFAINGGSVQLAHRYGFRRWGLLPRVTELEGERKDIEILGLELDRPRPTD